MNWITIELPAPLVVFGGIALASVLISLVPLSRFTGKPAPLLAIQDKMGLGGLNSGLFFLILLFWVTLFLLLFGGLLGTIYALLDAPIPKANQTDDIWSWRFSVLKLASLTAVLGAVVALPFTLIKLSLNRQQVETALEALTNDKMDNAVADLHAQRQVTKWKDEIASNGWEDDITRRNGAIDRLLGLVQENETLRPRVDRLLTVYLRELTREYPAKEAPKGATLEQITEWTAGLIRARSDMENAVQVLSRLPRPIWKEGMERLPDLQKINMQTFDLSGLILNGALLSGAKLQGANLRMVKLQHANLRMAQLHETNLFMANLQGADLFGAQLQGAGLDEANLQGADLVRANLQRAELDEADLEDARLSRANLKGASLDRAQLQRSVLNDAQLEGTDLRFADMQGAMLSRAKFDSATDLTKTDFSWAALRSNDLTDVPQIVEHLDVMFGDGSVALPKRVSRPAHWPEIKLNHTNFYTQWRAWQRAGGFDPDTPA